MSIDSYTILHAHDDKQIILKESDAQSRVLINTLVSLFGLGILLICIYLLRTFLTTPSMMDSLTGGRIGVFAPLGVVFGIVLIILGNIRFERSQFVLTPNAITIHHGNKFKRVLKRYSTENITDLFLEISGTVPQGGVVFHSGLALVFCYGSLDKVQETLNLAATLWNIPKWTYLLMDAPIRDQIAQGPSFGLEFKDDSEAMRNAERLSWQELGTAKQFAHLGHYDDPPRPGAREDGAFPLLAYTHSFWNPNDEMVTFAASDGTRTTVGFDGISEILLTPSPNRKAIQDPHKNTFYLYTATLTARLTSGETRVLTTVLQMGSATSIKVQGENIAEPRARRLAARLAEWSKVAVS